VLLGYCYYFLFSEEINKKKLKTFSAKRLFIGYKAFLQTVSRVALLHYTICFHKKFIQIHHKKFKSSFILLPIFRNPTIGFFALATCISRAK
jgi:hypothetical protein